MKIHLPILMVFMQDILLAQSVNPCPRSQTNGPWIVKLDTETKEDLQLALGGPQYPGHLDQWR